MVGDLQDGVHLATHPGIMHWDDRSGLRANQRLQLGLIQIEGVGADINKTGLAPRRTNAFTVETKVNEGMITSSPGWISSSRAAISRAWVQEGGQHYL